MTEPILSPFAEAADVAVRGLNPRLDRLSGATIGLFASFKGSWDLILDEVAAQLLERVPDLTFRRFKYPKDLNAFNQIAEVIDDPEYGLAFRDFVESVDAVVVANADAGSCSLYLTYNTAAVENLGKPVVLIAQDLFANIVASAASLRGVPALRSVLWDLGETSLDPDVRTLVEDVYPAKVRGALDRVIDALTRPLTDAEEAAPERGPAATRVVDGATPGTTNRIFYTNGWTLGAPVIPPTAELVAEMLTGTDLPPDHVLGWLPPMRGKATVEKIAVNAVMAGCLPTHLPAVIAAVEAALDPRMWIEAYTCSLASWAPLLFINGPARQGMDLQRGQRILSPYQKGSVTIGTAFALCLLNIAGVRPGIEDMAMTGHEMRGGFAIAEEEEASPWEPLHVFSGYEPDDSTVSLFWPNSRSLAGGQGPVEMNAAGILKALCDSPNVFGFDPGCGFVLSPAIAQLLADAGYSRRSVTDYVLEYARKPGTEFNTHWMVHNNHLQTTVPLPADASRSVRKFLDDLHLPIVVAGRGAPILFVGGGDHGGPTIAKMRLPARWDALVAKYATAWAHPTLP